MKKVFLLSATAILALSLGGCQSDELDETPAAENTAIAEPGLSDEEKAEVDALTQDIDTLLAELNSSEGARRTYVDGKLAELITNTDAEDLPPQLWKKIPNFTESRRAVATKN